MIIKNELQLGIIEFDVVRKTIGIQWPIALGRIYVRTENGLNQHFDFHETRRELRPPVGPTPDKSRSDVIPPSASKTVSMVTPRPFLVFCPPVRICC